MPFITGSDLAVRIRQMAPSKPILMLTAHFNSLGAHNPVDAVVRKPFAVDRLRAAVAQLLSAAQ
jgi:DNA-binding response OmpR family regulator